MGDPLESPRVAPLFGSTSSFLASARGTRIGFFFPPSGKLLRILVILFGPTPTNGTGRAELRAEAVGSLEKICASQRSKAYRN